MKRGLDLIQEINICETGDKALAFWWLGQMGYALKLGDQIIYLDPFLSQHPDRKVPSLLKPEEVTNADFIIGSHDHLDHIDRQAWQTLSSISPKAKFVVPKVLVPLLSVELNIPAERFIGLDDGISYKPSDRLKISGIAAAHEFLDRDPVTGGYPYLGFILEGNGCSLYHSGDTCIYEGMLDKLKSWDRLDVIFLPINGRDGKRYRNNIIGNMTYQEAVDLSGALKPGLAVPAHYEMFDGNTQDPAEFIDYLEAKYPGIQYWVGSHGTRVEYKSPDGMQHKN